MDFFRKIKFLRYALALIMGVVILNNSIDSPDSIYSRTIVGTNIKDSKNINDIETIYELITEVFLNMENHVPESDEADYEQILKKKDFLCNALILNLELLYCKNKPGSYPKTNQKIVLTFFDISSPPPDCHFFY